MSIDYTIEKEIGQIGQTTQGARKLLSLVSWNGRPAKSSLLAHGRQRRTEAGQGDHVLGRRGTSSPLCTGRAFRRLTSWDGQVERKGRGRRELGLLFSVKQDSRTRGEAVSFTSAEAK